MNKSIIIVFEIIVILLIVIIISGCTNPGETINRDITLNGIPTIQKINGSSDEWLINGTVVSRTNTQYKNVKLHITAYDKQGNVIGQKTFNITDLNQSANFQTVIKSNVTVDHVQVVTLNIKNV